jgi:hypothetical protein
MNKKILIPWPMILTVLLIIVKAIWAPTLSWWVIFMPLLIAGGFVAGAIIITLVVAFLTVWLDD